MTLSDFNVGWPIILGLLLVFGVGAWLALGWINSTRKKSFDIQKKSRLLTVGERKLFACLSDALSESYLIFAKVAMNEVVEPNSGVRLLDLKRIESELKDRHFDFILCDRSDMSIFGVIEIEHSKSDSNQKSTPIRDKQRERLITQVCKSANLKLFYFDVRQDYKNMDISRLITGKSKRAVEEDRMSPTHQSQLTIDNSSHSIAGHVRNCPKCRSEIVTKVSVKGSNIGEKFLMCRKYPYCDYRVSMKDLESLRKLEREEEKKSGSKGFKNWSAG